MVDRTLKFSYYYYYSNFHLDCNLEYITYQLLKVSLRLGNNYVNMTAITESALHLTSDTAVTLK